MAKPDLSGRLAAAAQAGRGLNLKPAEVAELVENIQTLATVVQRLNTQALEVSLPAEALADTIVAALGVDKSEGWVGVDHNGDVWTIHCIDDTCRSGGNTPLAAINLHRNRLSMPPLEKQTILIDGAALYEQLTAGE